MRCMYSWKNWASSNLFFLIGLGIFFYSISSQNFLQGDTMMNEAYKKTIVTTGIFCLLWGAPAVASESRDIQALKQQIQELIKQNHQLTKRVTTLEQDLHSQEQRITQTEQTTQVQAGPTQKKSSEKIFNTSVSLTGAIEVEAIWEDNFDGVSSSKLDLATADFAFSAQMTEWAEGLVAIEWDDDDDTLSVDEAFITIGNREHFPAFLKAGRYCVPFGTYEGNTISDPLTKEAFEAKEDTVQVGFASNGVYGNAYVFNGDTNEGGGDDTIEHFGLNLGYQLKNRTMAFDGSIDYINSVFDADGLSDGFPDKLEAGYVSGIAVHTTFGVGGLTIIGEYITALDDVDGSEPSAWQVEGCYTIHIADHGVLLGLAYSESEDLGGILPESRFAALVEVKLLEEVGLTLEYVHDEDYDDNNGGTDSSADSFTTQLAYKF